MEQMTAERAKMRDKLSMLIDEGIKSKKINADWAKRYAELKTSSEEEIAGLKARVNRQNDTLATLEREHGELGNAHVTSSHAYEHELALLRQRLDRSERDLKSANQTRDRAITEMLKMKEDSRKLIRALDLDNGMKETTLNHARNMAYVKKRKSLKDKQQAISYNLSSISEDSEDQNRELHSKAEESMIDQFTVEQSKVEQNKIEQRKVEQRKVEQSISDQYRLEAFKIEANKDEAHLPLMPSHTIPPPPPSPQRHYIKYKPVTLPQAPSSTRPYSSPSSSQPPPAPSYKLLASSSSTPPPYVKLAASSSESSYNSYTRYQRTGKKLSSR